MDGSVSNPATRRVFSNRKMIAKWQRSDRFKSMREEHARAPGIVCVHCKMEHGQQRFDSKGNPLIKNNGKPTLVILTINHKTRDLYLTEDLYCTWNPDKMEPCCTICNREYERGMKPCPKCLKAGYVRYIKWYDEECTACYFREHPKEMKKAEAGRESFKASIRQHNKERADRQRKAKVKHPCRSHRIGGICGLSAIGSRCTFSPSKALKKCSDAVAKKGTTS
jgi:hypothetical protein